MKRFIIPYSFNAVLIQNTTIYKYNKITKDFYYNLKSVVIEWLNENCNGRKYHDCMCYDNGRYNMDLKPTFNDEADFIAFKLRWS